MNLNGQHDFRINHNDSLIVFKVYLIHILVINNIFTYFFYKMNDRYVRKIIQGGTRTKQYLIFTVYCSNLYLYFHVDKMTHQAVLPNAEDT